jgi:hypothetical protein
MTKCYHRIAVEYPGGPAGRRVRRLAHLMYLRRGYRPDGRGATYRRETVPPGGAVRVDDELALMMTKRLS